MELPSSKVSASNEAINKSTALTGLSTLFVRDDASILDFFSCLCIRGDNPFLVLARIPLSQPRIFLIFPRLPLFLFTVQPVPSNLELVARSVRPIGPRKSFTWKFAPLASRPRRFP